MTPAVVMEPLLTLGPSTEMAVRAGTPAVAAPVASSSRAPGGLGHATSSETGGAESPSSAEPDDAEPTSSPEPGGADPTSSPDRSYAREALAAIEAVTAPMPQWIEKHPEAWLLEELPAGVGLAALADELEVADVDDAALVEMVRAWERVISFATARQMSTIAEMLRRSPGEGGRRDVIGEVSAMLRVSPRSGQTRVETAESLEDHPAVHDALAAGEIDPRRATALLNETGHLGRAAATTVIERVLPRAGDVTVPRLRELIRRAEILIDPEAVEKRHQAEKKLRCVAIRPAPDAMAWLEGYLPATQAVTLMTALDALASAAAPDDPRGRDERRVDGLVDLATQVLDRGTDVHGGPLADRHGRHPHISLTAALTTAAGKDEQPVHLGGYGLIPAPLARELMADAPAHVLLCDAQTGELIARSTKAYRPPPLLAATVEERDRTCTFPGCRMPARRCDIDHVDAYRPDRAGSDTQTTYENLQALCRHHHRMKSRGRWRAQRDRATGVTIWTSPSGHVYTRDPVPVHDVWQAETPPEPDDLPHPRPDAPAPQPEPDAPPSPAASAGPEPARADLPPTEADPPPF